MRGTTSLDFPVPVGGWRADLPLHKMPVDTLVCRPGDSLLSFNVVVDFDGLLKPRRGYFFLHDFGERIMGGISFKNSGGGTEIVVATLTHWYAYQGDGTWKDITGPTLLGEEHLPTRFVQFGPNMIYSVNGIGRNRIRRWIVGADTATEVEFEILDPDGNSYNPKRYQTVEYSANDLAVIGNRIILVGIASTVGLLPQQNRWCAVIDGTNWPTLAYNNVWDQQAGMMVAIQPTSQSSAVCYTENGPAYTMSGQMGSDASAFSFDRVPDSQSGPLSAAGVVNVGGRHFYLAQDQHVYECDGGQLVGGISQAVDSFLASAAGLVGGTLPLEQPVELSWRTIQKPVALHDRTRQKLWFFVAFHGDAEAAHALCLDLGRRVWEPPQQFPDGMTAAFPLLEQFGPTWDDPGIYAQTTLLNAIAWDTTLILTDGTGFTPTGEVQIDPDTDHSETVTYTNCAKNGSGQWVLSGCRRNAYPDGSVLATHAAGAAVIQYYSWDTAPWTSWDDIPARNEPAMYVGTSDGKLWRFFSGGVDRGGTANPMPISWSAMPAVINPGSAQTAQVNAVDVQVDPQAALLGGGDAFKVTLEGLTTPYDPNPVSILAATAQSDDPSTWFLEPEKTAGAGATLPSNYLRMRLSGVSTKNAPWIAGVTAYAYVQPRRDQVSL